MRPATVPSLPVRAQVLDEFVADVGLRASPSSSSTTWRGEARLERVRPEPSTGVDAGAEARAKASTTRGPGGGRAGAAEARAEQLHQHLGEEVVGVDVGGVDDLVERRRADDGDRFGVGGRRRRGRPSGGPGSRRRAASCGQLLRRQLRRVGGEAAGAGVAGEAGVEVEAGERADVGAGRVAGVGDAALAVEDRVVGVEAAGDRFDPGRASSAARGRRCWCRGRPGSCRRRPGVPRAGSPPPCR